MKIAPDVLDALSRAVVDNNAVRLTGQLDRKTYLKVNKVLEALGGKWNRKAKAHLFAADPVPLLAAAIDAGTVTTHRDIGFFPTPKKLAAQLVKMAGVRKGDSVLEPSAGTGCIVDAILARGALAVAVENDPKLAAGMRDKYKSEGRLGGPPPSAIVFERDFLDPDLFNDEAGTGASFDAVVMNPPFNRNTFDHVRRAYAMLRRNATLVSVLAGGIGFREDKRHKAFRRWCESRDGALTDLPERSFRESGTDVHACVLRVTRTQ